MKKPYLNKEYKMYYLGNMKYGKLKYGKLKYEKLLLKQGI